MKTQRQLLNLVPRVAKHPTHAVVDGVRYEGGLEEYRASSEWFRAVSDRLRADVAEHNATAARRRIARKTTIAAREG